MRVDSWHDKTVVTQSLTLEVTITIVHDPIHHALVLRPPVVVVPTPVIQNIVAQNSVFFEVFGALAGNP